MPAPHALLIEDAADTDLPAVQALYAHHVLHGRGTFEETPPPVQEMAERRAAVRALGLPYLVARRDGQVCGYCYAAPFRLRPAYRYTVEDSVYIAESARGQGVGRALLAALLTRCEAGPWRQMLALIGDSGNAGSIGLHRSLGFQPAGTFRSVGFKLGQWTDVLLMQRPLGAGDTTLPGITPAGTPLP